MKHKYQIDQKLMPLLVRLIEPLTRDELLESLSKQEVLKEEESSPLLDRLLRSGVLEEVGEVSQSSAYAYAYGEGPDSQRTMLADHVRTNSFRKAIGRIVKQGDVVIDVGAGTGILGMFAAKAGAKEVYLIENTPIIEHAKRFVDANNLSNQVKFFNGNAADFNENIRADVIVSEWIGFFLVEEYMFGAFASVRDKCLAKDGRVIPAEAAMYLAPIEDAHAHFDHGIGFWDSSPYGLDFTAAIDLQLQNATRVVTNIDPRSLISDPQKLMTIDCKVDTMEKFHFETSGEFNVVRDGSMHGFVGYFELDLGANVTIDTSPFAKSTHWKQVYLPTLQYDLRKHDRIAFCFKSEPGGKKPKFSLTADIWRDSKKVDSLQYKY